MTGDGRDVLEDMARRTFGLGWPGGEIDVSEGIFDQAWDESALPDALWHYTDAAGALGVIQTGELWATNALFMNDASEMKLAGTHLRHWLDSEAFHQALPDEEERKAFRVELDATLGRFEDDPRIFAVCFCTDGDLLGQWRAYAQEGNGYALGFDPRGLATALLRSYNYALFPVEYDEALQREVARQLLWHELDDLSRGHRGDRLRAVQVAATSVGRAAHSFAYRIKHRAFEHEQEWRLVYHRQPPLRDAPSFDAMFPFLERRYRPTARGIVPYVQVPITAVGGEPTASPLSEVRIGPTARAETSRRAVLSLLEDRGIDAAVSNSAIPLRA